MPPKLYSRQLSSLPESASLRARFTFVLVGPQALSVAQLVSQAELQTELYDAVGSMGFPKDGSERTSEGQVILKNLPNELGTYCMLDQDESVVGRLRFVIVGGFSDALPQLQDDNFIRNTCFMFLIDDRLDVDKEVMPVLDQGLAELNFSYNKAKSRSTLGRVPPPRVAWVRHCSRASGRPSQVVVVPQCGDEDRLLKFQQRLEQVGKDGPLRKVGRTADFNNAESLHACMQGLARDMYGDNILNGQASRPWTPSSKPELEQIQEDSGLPRNAKCCTVQ